MSEWEEEPSSGFGGGGGGGGQSHGFGRGRGGGGFGGRKRDDDSGDGGFGGRGGKTNGWGGGGDGAEDRPSGFGGRGRRRFEQGGENTNADDGESGGGRSGGFRGRGRGRGFGRSDADTNGEEGGESGFGGRSRGGFGGGRDNQDGGDGESGGFRGRGRGRGGRGGGRSFDNGDDGDSGGFRGRGRGRGGRGGFGGGRGDEGEDGEDGGRGRSRDGDDDGTAPPRKPLYIPPAPPEDEESLFATMAVGLNFDKYDEIPVETTGRDVPKEILAFEECGFSDVTMRNVQLCNYKRPTPVQKHAIPIVMAGRDLMACAQTGSGKTAAFLLPVITRMLKEGVEGASQAQQQSPQVLIISPTRELTLQIYGEARKFVHGSIYRPVVIYGGTSVGHQLRQLENGCNILVSTPGRLVDFLNRKNVLLADLQVLILDEADRMLDMGFVPEIRRVVEEFGMPAKGSRQTLMFSATFPGEIQQLAAEFLNDHIFLTVGVVGGTTSDIQQTILEVDSGSKRNKLQEILSESGSDRILVFVETKRGADFLASFLSQEQFPTTSIHGDRFQQEREEALRDFRSGRSRVLVATSVAARGLDIPKVKHVVNFDLPSSIEEYVHRIGRTGRIGNKGMATAFFDRDKDAHLARALVKVLAGAQQDVEPFLERAAEEAVGSNYGPAGGKFASKDIRYQGGGRRGNQFEADSGGFGDTEGGGGGFGGFAESTGGGFSATTEEEEW